MSRPQFDVINRYTGDGILDAFTFDFKLESTEHLLAIIVDDLGVEVGRWHGFDPEKIDSVDFEAGIPGGTVNLVDPLPNNYEIIILLANDEPTQPSEFREKRSFDLRSFENALDYLGGGLQRAAYLLSRAVRRNDIDDAFFDTQLPPKIASYPGCMILVNDTGDGFVMGPNAGQIVAAQGYAVAAAASATSASGSATASSASAATAAAAAASAIAAAQSMIWRDVVFKTFADSPINLVAADRAKMFVIDATGGNVVVNLPTIAPLDLTSPFVVGVKKTDSSTNTVTVNRGGADEIDASGQTSIVFSQPGVGAALIPDTDPAPDRWTSILFGATTGTMVVDTFDGTGAQVAFTLSQTPRSKNNVWIWIGGVYQQKGTYSVVGTTLTFTEAPPAGTQNIEVVSGITQAIGVPGDGSVIEQKMANESIKARAIEQSALGFSAMTNGGIQADLSGANLVISVKNRVGNDPTTDDPVIIPFRNAGLTTGRYTALRITGPLSLTIGAGVGTGTGSGGEFMGYEVGKPCRMWVVAFNDGVGGVQLGVINCFLNTTTTGASLIFPLPEWGVQNTSGHVSVNGGAMGVFLTTAALSNRPFRVLGHLDWNTSMFPVTKGVFGTIPDLVVQKTFAVPLPGSVVQRARQQDATVATGTTVLPNDNTIPQITEGIAVLTSVVISAMNPCNVFEIDSSVHIANTGGTDLQMALFNLGTANALAVAKHNAVAVSKVSCLKLNALIAARDLAGFSGNFQVRAGSGTAGTTTFNGEVGLGLYGARLFSYMDVKEIQT